MDQYHFYNNYNQQGAKRQLQKSTSQAVYSSSDLNQISERSAYVPYNLAKENKYGHWRDLFREEEVKRSNHQQPSAQLSEDYKFHKFKEYLQIVEQERMKSQQSQSNQQLHQSQQASTAASELGLGRYYRSISTININNLRRNMQDERQSQNIKFMVAQPKRERNHSEHGQSSNKIPMQRQKVYFTESNNNKSYSNKQDFNHQYQQSEYDRADQEYNLERMDSPGDSNANSDIYFRQTQRYLQSVKAQQKQLELITIYGQSNTGFFQKGLKPLPDQKQRSYYNQPFKPKQISENGQDPQRDQQNDSFIQQSSQNQQQVGSNQSNNNQDANNKTDQNQQLNNGSDIYPQRGSSRVSSSHSRQAMHRSTTIDKLPSLYQTNSNSPRKTKASFYGDDENLKQEGKIRSPPKKSASSKDVTQKEQRQQTDTERVVEKQKRRILMFRTGKTQVLEDDEDSQKFENTPTAGENFRDQNQKSKRSSPEFFNENKETVKGENSIPKKKENTMSQRNEVPLPKINENKSSDSPEKKQKSVSNTGTQVDFQSYVNIDDNKCEVMYPKNASPLKNERKQNKRPYHDSQSQEDELKSLLQKNKGKTSSTSPNKIEANQRVGEDGKPVVDGADNKDNKVNSNRQDQNQKFLSPKYKIMSNLNSAQQLQENENESPLNTNSNQVPSNPDSPAKSKEHSKDSPRKSQSNYQSAIALSRIIKPNSSSILKVQRHKYIDPCDDAVLNISPDGAFTNLQINQDKENILLQANSAKSGKPYQLEFKRIACLDSVFPEVDIKKIIDVKINSQVNEQYLDFRGESILRVAKLDEYEMEKQLNSAMMEKETNGKGQFTPRNAYLYRNFIIEQFDRFYFLQDQISSFIVQKEALSEHQFKSMMLNLLDIILAKRITRITHDNVVFCLADQKFYCIDRLYNYAPIDEFSELSDPYKRQQQQEINGQSNTKLDEKNYIILQDLIDLIAQIKFQTFSRNELRQSLQIQSIKSPFLAFIIKELQTAKQQQQQVQQQQQLNQKVAPINVFTQLENIRKNIIKHRLEAHDIIKRDGDIFSHQILMKPRRFKEYIDMLYYGSDVFVDQNILSNSSQVNQVNEESKINSATLSKANSKQLASPIHSQSSLSQKDSQLKSALSAKKLKDAVKKTQKKSLYEIMFDQAMAKKDISKIVEYGNHIFPRRLITKSNLERLYAYIEAKLEKNDLTDINFYMSKYIQINCEQNSQSLKYGKMQLQLAQHNIDTNTPLSATMLICIYLENKFQNIPKYEIEKRLAYNKLMSDLSQKSKIENFEIAFLRDSCLVLEEQTDIESFSQALFNVSKWYLHQDRVKKGLKYIHESIKITQNEKFKQYCEKIIDNAENSLKKFKLQKDSPNIQKNVKEAYTFYNDKNIGEVETRLQNIKKELSDNYYLKEREVIDIYYLAAKEQIKYDETASSGGANLDLFQGYANSSEMYSDEELKNCNIEIYGIYGDLYAKEKRYLEGLLEYFSKIVQIDSNRHEEFEITLLKMSFMIYELNKGEYLGSILNCLNNGTVIYQAIETLHLLAKAIVLYQEVEANQYSTTSTQYTSTKLLNKALAYVEKSKQIGKQNQHIKLKILLRVIDTEYQIIEKLGNPELLEERIEALKKNFEEKLSDQEQFLLFQEYINIYLIDTSPFFDINFFSKCEKAAELAIHYEFYSHAIKDLEICLNLKMELGVQDVMSEVRSILFILDKVKDRDEIKKCLELIQTRMDSIESDDELFEFILKFVELSQDKEKVVELTLNNFKFILKMHQKNSDPKLIEVLFQKIKFFTNQGAIDQTLRLSGMLIQLLELDEIQNSDIMCKVYLNSIKLCYAAKKPDTETIQYCDSFFGHLVFLTKQPSLNKDNLQEIQTQINLQFGDKGSKFKEQLKNYLKQHKITNPNLIAMAK